ncbi:DEAD/DEAH box helicase [Actinomyces slackii]|uniref:ATP-dependent helicase HepA n=1 Tax=Actinomyces slackii TaxID=52774 RepID=A0A448KB81_9ACTO|nr:DEAD/DEAH box helicase [Actinomyces slackii]VEG74198.1 ATP-dependent helicase HepA [Actinomyces slackii]
MSREIQYGDWPAGLSDERIIATVGGRAYMRGQDYALRGMVRGISVAGGGDIITAQVRGSGSRVYQTIVFRSSARAWSGSCSCPVGADCKHAAALMLTARALAEEEPEAQLPAWESQLRQILHVERARLRSMALEVALAPERGWMQRETLSLRPLIEGQRGWKRQGASWRRIYEGDLDGEVAPAILDALKDLVGMVGMFDASLYYSDSRLDLATAPSRIWSALRRGVEAGLVLTTAQRNGASVRLLEGLRAGVTLQDDPDGSLSILPSFETGEIEELAGHPPLMLEPLGDPVHACCSWLPDGELLLLPLDPPPGPALARVLGGRTERLTIPAPDVPRFEAEHLEAVVAALPVIRVDEGIRLPEPVEAGLVLTVRIDPEAHRLRTSWSVRYTTASGEVRRRHELENLSVVAESVSRDLPPASRDEEDSARVRRDPEAEARLASAAFNALLSDFGRWCLWRSQAFDGMDTARFMTTVLPHLQQAEGFTVEVIGEAPDYREAADAPLITTDVSDDDDRPDWFSLRVSVRVGDEEIPIPRLMTALAAGEQEVLLDSGLWVSIDRPEIHALARLMEEGRELEDPQARGTLRVTSLHAGYYEALEALGVVGSTTRRWKERVGRLLERIEAAEAIQSGEGEEPGAAGDRDVLAAPVPQGLSAELRPYQLEGYRWLDLLRSLGLGGVLADDMGLGKTVQVLAAVQRMVEQRGAGGEADAPAGPADLAGSAGPADPAGSVGAPDPGAGPEAAPAGPAAPAHPAGPAAPADPTGSAGAPDPGAGPGTGPARPVLVIAPTSVVGSWVEQAERFCPGLRVRTVARTTAKREHSVEEIASGADVVVSSYTIVRLCEEEFADQQWDWVVCDEAQFLKNHASATYKAVRRLPAPSTIAITGTPLENSLMDLWSLMSISAPGLLPGPERFRQLYHRPIDRGDGEALERLQRRMRPFLLRRTKEQVAAELPAKTEQVLAVELGAAHRRAYDQRLARERQKVLGLLEEDSAQARFSILKALTTLRQMALDPALLEESPAGGARRKPTAKVTALVEHLEPILAEGHRALVFSQFTRYLTGVRDHLEGRGITTAYLDGATSRRQEVIDSFRAGGAQVFCISLKAGGFGLTLTEADYVFLLDPWWNPQVEEQAVDRTHRIGQDRPVMVYRMVSAQTIEDKVMALKEKKAELFERVVEGTAAAQDAAGGGAGAVAAAAGPAALSAAEIRELIEG